MSKGRFSGRHEALSWLAVTDARSVLSHRQLGSLGNRADPENALRKRKWQVTWAMSA
jgi:hypothetical protein